MGFSGISAVQLGIVLLIVILIFGTKKLRNLGEDVGGGIRGIRDGFGGDLGDAAEEIGRAKKSLEELQDRVNGIERKDLDSSDDLPDLEWHDEDYESSRSSSSGHSSSR